MSPTLKNILAVVAGIFIGGAVNMGLVVLGSQVIPLPGGLDGSDPEALKAAMPMMTAKHFIFPFLAHALGTLVGAFVAAKFSANRHLGFALFIGFFFLLGGITAATMIPAPTWFIILDLLMAYIPMAFLGAKIAGR